MKYLLIIAIAFYRWFLSPAKSILFGPLGRCRFTPSCSAYALEAVRQHGAYRGSWLSLKRVCRCHPWGRCGVDPVPSFLPERQGLNLMRGWASGAQRR